MLSYTSLFSCMNSNTITSIQNLLIFNLKKKIELTYINI